MCVQHVPSLMKTNNNQSNSLVSAKKMPFIGSIKTILKEVLSFFTHSETDDINKEELSKQSFFWRRGKKLFDWSVKEVGKKKSSNFELENFQRVEKEGEILKQFISSEVIQTQTYELNCEIFFYFR